jgi:hypothetical protein
MEVSDREGGSAGRCYPTYHRKSAVRLLNRKPIRKILVYGNGEAVKIKPEKNGPPNNIFVSG